MAMLHNCRTDSRALRRRCNDNRRHMNANA